MQFRQVLLTLLSHAVEYNRVGAEGLGIQGSGTGLTIGRQLIELIGGAIAVSGEEVGVGSRFWMELPKTEVSAAEPSTGM